MDSYSKETVITFVKELPKTKKNLEEQERREAERKRIEDLKKQQDQFNEEKKKQLQAEE